MSFPFYIFTFILIILTISGSGIVSAYYLSLDAPAEVRVGQPLHVNGTTNIPPPDKVDVIFSQSVNIPVEVARQAIQITEKGDNAFNVSFDTTGLLKGNYKVEAISQTQRDFSAGSRNLRVVKLIDRSDIIRFSSPLYQEFNGNLVIEARIQGFDDNSVQLEIKKGNSSVFGPESVPVTKGLVKYEQPVKEQGIYSVTFHDSKGYIGSYPVQIGEETKEPIKAISTTGPVATTEGGADTPTQKPTPKPTEKPSEVTPAPTPLPQSSPGGKQTESFSSSEPVITKTTHVSRDSPGYFTVLVKKTPITITTSANADWVLEYKVSPDAAMVKVNDNMKEAAEKATITADTKHIFIKVYPYNYKSGEEVTITANNAEDISLSDEAAKAFGAPPRYGSDNTPGKSPAPLAGMILGLIGAAWCIRRR
jgi:hypothetical protein